MRSKYTIKLITDLRRMSSSNRKCLILEKTHSDISSQRATSNEFEGNEKFLAKIKIEVIADRKFPRSKLRISICKFGTHVSDLRSSSG